MYFSVPNVAVVMVLKSLVQQNTNNFVTLVLSIILLVQKKRQTQIDLNCGLT